MSSGSLNDELGSPVSSQDAGLHVLSVDQLGKESSDKGITSSVGVDQEFLGQGLDGVLGDNTVAGNDGAFGTLGEDNGSGLTRLLWQGGNGEGNLFEVLSHAILLSVGGGFALVSEQEIGVFHGGGQLVSEKVDNEGCRKVEAESLVVGDGVFGNLDQGFDGNRQEKSSAVVNLGKLNDLLGLFGGQVGWLEVVGGIEVGDQGSLSILDEGGAGSSGCFGILHVVDVDTVGLGALFQGLSSLVVSDASEKGSVLGLVAGAQHPLGNTNGVLGGTSGNVFRVVLFDQLLEKRLVLGFGKDGRVQLDLVLVKEILSDLGGDIEKGVSHSQNGSGF